MTHINEFDSELELLIPGVVVLSEADFNAAIETAQLCGEHEGPCWAPVDAGMAEEAAIVAGVANNPDTVGIVARLHQTADPVPFSGSLFAILADPALDDGADLVSSRSFRLAAVQLSGTARWVGIETRLARNLGIGVEADRCCGKPTLCAPYSGRPIEAFGNSAQIGITTRSQPIFDSRSPTMGGAVPLTFFGGPDPDETLDMDHNPAESPPIQDLNTTVICQSVLSPPCTQITPLCNEGDPGYTLHEDGVADIPAGSNPCGAGASRPVRGRNVPEECTYAYFGPDSADAACGGTYGIRPGRLSRTMGDSVSGQPYSSRLFCRAASFVPGSGSPCDPQTEIMRAARAQQLALEAGWLPGMGHREQCDPPGERGIRRCIVCDDETGCHETVDVPPYDPAIADASDTTAEDLVNPVNTGALPRKPLVHRDAIPAPSTPAPAESPQPAAAAPAGPKDKPEVEKKNSTLPVHPPTPESRPGLRPRDLTTKSDDKPVGDPVDPGDGSLLLTHTDLAFPGPVRDLVFERMYRSASRNRSGLGSNWIHNWDVHLEVLDEQTVPAWLSPWCAGMSDQATAITLHWGDGSSDLFLLDVATRLFLPHAGSAATLARTTAGWALRFPDGRILTFNSDGYLVRDADRFGNAFTIDYEPTPLGRLFQHYCSPAELARRNETLAARRNALLAWLVGANPRPERDRSQWAIQAIDFPLPPDPDEAAELAAPLAYLLFLASGSHPPESLDGGRRLRPVQVTDPLGRSLRFEYWEASTGPKPQPADYKAMPQHGLLREVRGPAGASVSFTYSRPARYPEELNELFLAGVRRADTLTPAAGVQPAPTRDTVFEYQWPGGSVPSYDGSTAVVESLFLAYYRTFVGCWYNAVETCLGGSSFQHPQRAPGDPLHHARLARNAYISDVADNILTVRHAGVVEAESRFAADPFDDAFDRVVAQRYGSSTAVQDLSRMVADGPGAAWATSLPKAVFAYCDAGPDRNGVDRTEAFLPQAIRERYPLEAFNAVPTRREPANTTRSQPDGCDYEQMTIQYAGLPGSRSLLDYFDAPEPPKLDELEGVTLSPAAAAARSTAAAHFGPVEPPPVRLLRTPLHPNQLIGAQLSDPTHNDLLCRLTPNPADVTRPLIERIVGRRAVIAANNNRICSWVRVTDRDGDVRYLGLNYRGQTLVEAVEEGPARYVFTERVYNADGNLVEQRRPSRSTNPWRVADGRTRYRYDEIDPRGNRGWDGWLPVYWSRRQNLIEVEVQAPGDGVLDDDEQGGFTVGLARFTRYRYEPLFNQTLVVEVGSVRAGGQLAGRPLPPVETVHQRVDHVYDYQELSAGVDPLDPTSIDGLLEALQPWGFHWLRQDPDAFAFQLGVELHGADINGDQSNGNRFAARPEQRGVGLPIMRIESCPSVPNSDLVWLHSWAPHGLPGRLEGPDGDVVRHEYYPADLTSPVGPFGRAQVPGAADANVGYRGMLARVTAAITRAGFPLAGPLNAPVTALPGPYRWVGIDPATTDPGGALRALGLPSEQVDDLMASVDHTAAGASTSVAYTYNRCGHNAAVFHANGARTMLTDTDGRVLKAVDERGTLSATAYDVFGRPLRQSVSDAAGAVLGDRRFEYDEDDNLMVDVTAAGPGGADQPPTGPAITWTYRYTPEGSPFESTDPEGLVTRRRYDACKQLIEVVEDPVATGEPPRAVSLTYDLDGQVTSVRRGAPGLIRRGPSATRRYAYDGLGRLVSAVDERGIAWQQAWSSRDQPTRQRRSEQPYPALVPSTGPADWETDFTYDTFGRLTRQRQNGTITRRLNWTAGGAVFAVSGDGAGITWTVSDLLGREVWRQEPGGTETITTYSEQPHRTIASTVRRVPGRLPHVTTTRADLDPAGDPAQITQAGQTVQIPTLVGRDGLGREIRIDGPLGEQRTLVHDWAGRVTEILDLTNPGGVLVRTFLRYDGRGALRRVEDPAGQIAEFAVDGFGQPAGASVSGSPQVLTTATRDLLGRLTAYGDAQFRLERRYASNHDPIAEVLLRPGGPVDVIRRSFDELGRLVRIENTNAGLTWLPESARTVMTEVGYDRAGRVRSEQTTSGGTLVAAAVYRWLLANPDNWQRLTASSIGLWSRTLLDDFDAAGRLASAGPVGPSANRIAFSWLGELYTGRSQPQPGWSSRFTEEIGHDALGLVDRITYRAVGIDGAGQPVDLADGSRYCPPGWDPAICAAPLLTLDVTRDAAGRTALETWRHGHPVIETNGALRAGGLPIRLRGYLSTLRRRLALMWEDDNRSTALPPALSSYTHSEADLRAATTGATAWSYRRENTTEDLLTITGPGAATRWELSAPRATGHQLTGVAIDGQARTVSHDPGGRVIVNGLDTYTWHPTGQLATVSRGGVLIEAYAYDGFGRLAAVFRDRTPGPALYFAYNGDQMVAAVNDTGRPVWDAHWGPLTNQLLSWRERAQVDGEHIPLLDPRHSVLGMWHPAQAAMPASAAYTPEGRVTVRDSLDTLVCADTAGSRPCLDPSGNPFAFGSAYRSSVTGLVSMRSRWYAPDLGQFLSADPAGFADGTNRYAYAANDPVNRVDPFGLTSRSNGAPSGGARQLNRQPAPAPTETVPAAAPPPAPGLSPIPLRDFIRRNLGGIPPQTPPGINEDRRTDEQIFQSQKKLERLLDRRRRHPGVSDERAAMLDYLAEYEKRDAVRLLSQFGTGKNVPGAAAPLEAGKPPTQPPGVVAPGRPSPPRNPYYIPRYQLSPKKGEVIPLEKHQPKGGIDVPLPDPAAKGAPHTVLGGRVGSRGEGTYRQSATFPETRPNDASSNFYGGQPIPIGRVDWTTHNQPDKHTAPHIHGYWWIEGTLFEGTAQWWVPPTGQPPWR